MEGKTLWAGRRFLVFKYRDAEEQLTARKVTTHRVFQSGPHVYLLALCHDRNDDRHFRVDRIQGQVADMETGELGHLKELLPYQREAYVPPTGKHSDNPVSQPGQRKKRGRRKPPPYDLPLVNGTDHLPVVDLTDYREVIRDIKADLDPEERKELDREAVLRELSWGGLEFEVGPFDDFVARHTKGLAFPKGVTAEEALYPPQNEHRPYLVHPDDPCLHGPCFEDGGPPGAADLAELGLAELKPMAKALGLKVSQKKPDLCAALAALGDQVPRRLAKPVVTELEARAKRISTAYLQELIPVCRDLPPVYQAAVWGAAMEALPSDEFLAMEHAQKLWKAAERKADEERDAHMAPPAPKKPKGGSSRVAPRSPRSAPSPILNALLSIFRRSR